MPFCLCAPVGDGALTCAFPRRALTLIVLVTLLASTAFAVAAAERAEAHDNVWACSVPVGHTYDTYVRNGACGTVDRGEYFDPIVLPMFHVREPAEGMVACTRPEGFFFDFSITSPGCLDDDFINPFSEGRGNIYRLWDIRPRTLTAATTSVAIAPPATGRTVLTWTTPATDRLWVSDNGGPERLVTTGGSGSRTVDVVSGHTYVYRLYTGVIDNRHLAATVTVRGVPRTLSSVSPSVARRPDGKVDVLARGTDGNADIATLAPSGRLMSPWASLGRKILGAPAGTWSADGRTLDVFAVGEDRVVLRRQFRVGSGWGAWSEVVGGRAAYSSTVGVARNATGISLFIRGVDGYAYTERVGGGGALQGASWTRMANQYVVGAPTGTWSPDGKALMVAAVGADYSIYLRRQSGGTWGDWRREPGNGGAYAATVGLADRGDALALFVRGSNGNAYIESLTSTGALTSTWRAFDMQVMGSPTASFNPERTAADVIAVGTDNRIYRRHGPRGSAWEAWTNSQLASPTVGIVGRIGITGVAGEEKLLARGNNATAYVETLTATGGLGAGWATLDRQVGDAAPSGSWSPDGSTLDVVSVGVGGVVQRRQYLRASNTWTAWADVPNAPPAAVGAMATIASSATDVTIGVKAANGYSYVKTFPRSGPDTSPWTQVDRPLLGGPALSWSPDGAVLELAGIANDHTILRRQYRRASDAWTAWSRSPNDGAASTSTVSLAGYGGGVSMLVRATNGSAYVQTYTRDGLTIMNWTNLLKQVLGAPSGYWSADGKTLDVVVVGTDFNAWRKQYVRATGAWSAWQQVPAGGSAPYFALPTAVPATADPALGGEDDGSPVISAPQSGVH
jgi:hypothetical protein